MSKKQKKNKKQKKKKPEAKKEFDLFQSRSAALMSLKSQCINIEETNKRLLKKIDEEGIVFQSYRDGKKISLTPESTIIAQKQIGADIIIPLDELPGIPNLAKLVQKFRFQMAKSWLRYYMVRGLGDC